MTQGTSTWAAMSRPELEQELVAAYQRSKATLLRLHATSSALHEMTEALSGLLVLHLEGKPVEVYDRLNALAARYVRSAGDRTLADLAHAAGRVH